MKNFAVKSNFEKRLKEYYKDKVDIVVYCSEKSSYTSIKSISKKKNILSVYYRSDGIRIQIKDNEKYKKLYYNQLSKEKVCQRDSARPKSTPGFFQFYVSQTNVIQVVTEYVEYIINLL